MSELEQDERRRVTSQFERHAQTIITSLVLGGILFVVNATTQTQSDIKLVKQSVQYLEKRFEEAAGDRYTAGDADRDKKYLESRIDFIETRIDQLEKTVKY